MKKAEINQIGIFLSYLYEGNWEDKKNRWKKKINKIPANSRQKANASSAKSSTTC